MIRTTIGINPNGVYDASDDRLLADALRHASDGYASLATGQSARLDPDGSPAEDYSVIVAKTRDDGSKTTPLDGTYAIRFSGQATVTANGGPPGNSIYDAATNTTTVTIAAGGWPYYLLKFSFAATRKRTGDAPGTGTGHPAIMRPIAAGSATPHPFGELFNRQASTMPAPVGLIRDLDLNSTNGTTSAGGTTDAARRLPADPIQSGGPNGVGIADEYRIELANVTGASLHLTIPIYANDDKIRRLIQRCRYGSDGVNPYTKDQSNPTYRPLQGRLYLEDGNETWNYGTFIQSSVNRDTAAAVVAVLGGTASSLDPVVDAEVAAGCDYNFDQCGNAYEWATRRHVYRTVRIRDLAAEVYGEDAFNVRFFPVLMGQQVAINGLDPGIAFLRHHDSRPISQLISVVGASWYHGPAVLSAAVDKTPFVYPTPDQVFASPPATTWPDIEAAAAYAAGLGIPLGCYEGGEVFCRNEQPDPAIDLIQNDPRYAAYVRNTIDLAVAHRPVFLDIYGTTQGPWGLCDSCDDLSSVKYTASVAAVRDLTPDPELTMTLDNLFDAQSTTADAAKADAAKAKASADAATAAHAAFLDGLRKVNKPYIRTAAGYDPEVITLTPDGFLATPAVTGDAVVPEADPVTPTPAPTPTPVVTS